MKKRILTILPLLLVLTMAVFPKASAAFSIPPSWNPMTMPGVTYNSASNLLAANPVAVPGYGVLGTNTKSSGYVGNPAPGIASFDPTTVWSVLNNTAFSRWIGWSDPNEGDTTGLAILDRVRSVYGPDANIWIDCLTKSAGLNTYLAVGSFGVNSDSTLILDYANPTGIPYSPIFGTPGSSTKWLWDGVMDHNTNAVPFSYLTGPNQPFSATYRLYIGDTAGSELLTDKNGTPVSSAATTTTWNWRGPAFVFTSQSGVPSGTEVESDAYTATGIAAPGTSAISIDTGEYALSTDGGASWGAWTSAAGTIANTNKVKIRQTSAAGHGVTSLATLAIPGVPGTGQFRVTTTSVPDPAWPVKIRDGYDQPSLAFAYTIAPDMAEPNHAVIMIRDAEIESSFLADRNITVTLAGGYNTDFTAVSGVTTLMGTANVMIVRQGKVTVDNLFIKSTTPL